MGDILDTAVLQLNRQYNPIGTISVREAFSKFWAGVAEAVLVSDDGAYESYDFASWADISSCKELFDDHNPEWVHTPSLTLLVPRIIRVLNYEKQKTLKLKPTRRNIYERDNHACQYCGHSFSTKELNLDHIEPQALGGKSTWTNLVCACIPCNSKKACRTPEQAGMKLIRPAKAPPSMSGFSLPKGMKRYKNWDLFVSQIYWNTPLEP